MKEALSEYDELLEEYCESILNAQDEEEVALLKQQMTNSFREIGLDETTIQYLFAKADAMLDNVYSEANTSLGIESDNINIVDVASIGGLGLVTLVAVLAFKQSVLKKQKRRK